MSHKLTKEEDKEFRAVLLRDVPYFHKLYSKYKDPQYLEIVRNLGITLKKLNHRIEMI